MAHHQLKINKAYYEAKVDGRKSFEIRRDDRGFNVDDTIEYLTSQPPHLELPGTWRITYITDYEQKDGFVVFGDERVIVDPPSRTNKPE